MTEIAHRLVADVRIDRGPGEVRSCSGDQQRVAIGFGARHLRRSDCTGVAGLVLDIELLAERVGEFRRHQPAEDVRFPPDQTPR